MKNSKLNSCKIIDDFPVRFGKITAVICEKTARARLKKIKTAISHKNRGS